MRRVVPLALLLAAALLALPFSSTGSAVRGGPVVAGDVAWMLTAAGLVLLMTPGLSFFYGGMVQKKNVISTMLQSFMAMVVISILWVVIGFSLAFGDSIYGLIGSPTTYFMFHNVGTSTHPALAPTIPLLLFALFHLKFAIITPALITGSFGSAIWKVVAPTFSGAPPFTCSVNCSVNGSMSSVPNGSGIEPRPRLRLTKPSAGASCCTIVSSALVPRRGRRVVARNGAGRPGPEGVPAP